MAAALLATCAGAAQAQTPGTTPAHPPAKPAHAPAHPAKAPAHLAKAPARPATASHAPAPAASAAHVQLPGLADRNNGKPISIEADNGIEWQQNNHVYIARGNAMATRGDDTVKADTLSAFYRPVAGAPPPPAGKNESDPLNGGSTEIYRLDADGHVVFRTPTDTMFGDHAVYDVDKTVLVVTGKALKIVTPTRHHHGARQPRMVRPAAARRGARQRRRDPRRPHRARRRL